MTIYIIYITNFLQSLLLVLTLLLFKPLKSIFQPGVESNVTLIPLLSSLKETESR